MAPRQTTPLMNNILEEESPDSNTDSEEVYRNVLAVEALEELAPKFADSCVRMLDPRTVARKIARIAFAGFRDLLVIMDVNVPFRTYDLYGEGLSRLCHIVSRHPGFPDEPVEGFGDGVTQRGLFEATCEGMGMDHCEHQMKIALQAGLTKDKLVTMAEEAAPMLETKIGAAEMFGYIKAEKVLVMVASGDPLGDVYETVYDHHGLKSSHLYLVTDTFHYDENGDVLGRSDAWWKVQRAVANGAKPSNHFFSLSLQRNVIIITQDPGFTSVHEMAVNDPEVILKMGLLDEEDKDLLPEYLDKCDIVILNDETLDLPSQLLKAIGLLGDRDDDTED